MTRILPMAFALLWLTGCNTAGETTSVSADGCVNDNEVNSANCRASCESATSKAECSAISDAWPYPEDWADFWHYCDWHPLVQTEVDSDGHCTFGETIGRCAYWSGGEGDYLASGIQCGDYLFRRQVTLSMELDGQIYLGRFSMDPWESNVVSICDDTSSPLCSCPCQEDFPSYDNWNQCDFPDALEACSACRSCTHMAHCYQLSEDCWADDGCREVQNCTQLNDCYFHDEGSQAWLDCVEPCLAAQPTGAEIYQELYRCILCDNCTQSCAADEGPTCAAWATDTIP